MDPELVHIISLTIKSAAVVGVAWAMAWATVKTRAVSA